MAGNLWGTGDGWQQGFLGHRRRDMVIEQDCHSENDEFGYAWAIILWSMLLCSCVSCVFVWYKYHKAKKQVDQERASLLHIHNGHNGRKERGGPEPQGQPSGSRSGTPDRMNARANGPRPNNPRRGPPEERPKPKKQKSWQKRREETKAVATLGPRPANRLEQEALKAQTALMELEVDAQKRTIEIQKLDKELAERSRVRDLLEEHLKGLRERRPVFTRQKVVEVEVSAQSERAIVEHVETPYKVEKVVENVVPVATLVPDPSAALKLEYALDDVRELRDAVAEGPPVVPSARTHAYQQPPPITIANGWYGNPPPVLVIDEPPLYSDQALYSEPLFADPILVEEDYFAPSRQTPSPAPMLMDEPPNRLLVDPSSPFSRPPFAYQNPNPNPFSPSAAVTRPPIPNSKDHSQSTLDPIFGGSPRTIYDTSIPTARA